MVVGAQRTGSTLLATAVGMLPGATVVGELRLLWQSLVEGRPCACLKASTTCEVWTRVVDEVMDTPDLAGVSIADLAQLNADVLRQRSLARMLAGRLPDELAPLVIATRRLYPALAKAHGVNVLADSSKSPAFFGFVRALESAEIDLRAVHLVRDVRGVVDSWSRDKHWERDGWSEELHAKPAGKAVVEWLAMNSGAEIARVSPRMRFEDVMEAPDAYLARLSQLVGLPAVPNDDDWPIQNGSLIVRENHAIGGNVDRFDTGPVALRTEEGWRQRLDESLVRRYAPLAKRYGYVP
jgi:Sulfotransferase family